MRAMGHRGPALLLLGVLFFAFHTEASHFRYGTIAWRPLLATGIPNHVSMEFEAAYRRDFEWGKFFREQWAVGPEEKYGPPDWQDGGSCYTDLSCSVLETAPAIPFNYYQFFNDKSVDYTNGGLGGWYIKLSTGLTYYQLSTAGGKQCDSAYDTGDYPTCPEGVAEGTVMPNKNRDSETGLFIDYDANPADGDLVPCEIDDNVRPDYCSPWSQTYGFFLGDGTFTDVILTVTEVNHEENFIGNFLLGRSIFEHTYPSPKQSLSKPWTAYFTGGNRISYSLSSLNNNGQGRFRVEITVNLQPAPIRYNMSPKATSFPVLPVPYVGRGGVSAYGMLSTFQISAFDPNFDEDAFSGSKELHNENVYFFIGNTRKHGQLLANQVPDLKYPSRWFEDRYEDARMECYNTTCYDETTGIVLPWPQSCGNCKKGDGRICATQAEVDVNGNTIVRELEFSCEMYPPWKNEVNLAHGPPRMAMNVSTGIVQWEVGINPYENDTDVYAADWDIDYDGVIEPVKGTKPDPPIAPLEPGFYNLVVDIRSKSQDPDCPLVAASMTPSKPASACDEANGALMARDAPEIAYVSTPLDFLLYLYPPASWCSTSLCKNSQRGIRTFRDFGIYGDAKLEEEATEESRWMYDAPGTGICTICGGGDDFLNLTDYKVCLEDDNCGYDSVSLVPPAGVCFKNQIPRWVDQTVPGVEEDGKTPTPIGDARYAVVYGKRSKPVGFEVVATDDDDCVELSIHPTGLYTGLTMFSLDATGYPDYTKPVCTFDESQAGECGLDMKLSNTTRVGTDGKTVKRDFTWLAKKRPEDPEYEQDKDPRPPNVVVCFFPFDNYAVGPFRCVNIILTMDKELYWRDQRPKLITHGDQFTGVTPANETTFYVAPGYELEFIMSAKQDTGYGPIRIFVSQGEIPEGATFDYTVSGDPANRTFVWTPVEGQQCEYMICFTGNNTRMDEALIDKTAVFDAAASLDERCYSIIVMDQGLDFAGGTYVDAPGALPYLTADCGMTLSMWFMPEGTMSMPLATIGYTTAGSTTKEMVHQLSWEPLTDAVFKDAVTSQDLGQYYRLVFQSGNSYVTVLTEATFCVDEWHFATLTIDPEGKVKLYLDGIETVHFSEEIRDYHNVAVETGDLPVTDGKVEIIGTILGSKPGSTGFFYLGSFLNPFDGKITDVRVYSRALSAKEIGEKMFEVLDPTKEIGLEAYYKFNEGNQLGNSLGNLDAPGSYNKYGRKKNSTETTVQGDTTGDYQADSPLYPYETEMNAKGKTILDYSGKNFHATASPMSVDGDLHFEWLAAPTMPACPKEFSPDQVHVNGGQLITISGTGFARSQWLKCSFSMMGAPEIVRAAYINNSTIVCENPGAPYLTASMLEVTNGAYYSNMKIPIYEMERALSLPATGGAITVPGVCSGLSSFSVGGWVYPQAGAFGAVFTLTGSTGSIEVNYYESYFMVAEFPTGGNYTTLAFSADAPFAGQGAGAGWHYVLLSMNEGVMSLFVDGVENTMTSQPSMSLTSSTDCHFVVGGNTPMVGLVEEVTLWSKPLSMCQAYQLMWGNLTQASICPTGDSIGKFIPWNDHLVTYLQMNDFGLNDVALDTSDRFGTSGTNGVISGDAAFQFCTVPFLAPSFNRPRPRIGPPTKQFDYGPPTLDSERVWMENYTIPRAFDDYYEYVVFPGLFEEELVGHSLDGPRNAEGTTVLSVDGMANMTLLGFGFAESQWLKCEFDGKLVDLTYEGIDMVTCDVPSVEYPGHYSMGVLNLYPDSANCSAEYWGEPASRLGTYVPDLEMKEAAISFDGVADYAFSSEVATAIGTDWEGVTFGAWFYPEDETADKEQPIMCFTTGCGPIPAPPPPDPTPAVYEPCGDAEACPTPPSPPPPCPPPPPSPPPFSFTYENTTIPYTQVCLMYKAGMVYIQSDLLSHSDSDSDTLYLNATAAAPAPSGSWHYAEVHISGNEISPYIESDGFNATGNVPTYIAKMIVDEVLYDGSADGGDIRVPVHPETLANGGFFIGGEGCDTPTGNPFFLAKRRRELLDYTLPSEPTFYTGLIDEVRVFKGLVATDWFHRLSEQDAPTPVAHYRMSTPSSGALSQSLYQMRPVGPFIADHSGNGNDAVFYEWGSGLGAPDYEYVAVPFEAATTHAVSVADMMLYGNIEVTVDGYNVAESQWLYCAFYGAEVSGPEGTMTMTAYGTTAATFVDDTTVRCTSPAAPMPGIGYVQITSPKGAKTASFEYLESAMDFQGDQVVNMEVIGGTANEHESVDLLCPIGMRMDKVLFASYGRPDGRCNAKNVTECDQSVTLVPCDYMGYTVNPQCDSDTDKPPYFTMDIVEKHCLGKGTCSIPALNSLFGDPCPSKNKWLSVAMRCSDRWSTKDYVQADEINALLEETPGWTIGMWVYPHGKQGNQALLSMGGSPGQDKLNRHVLQWRGDKNVGQFFYYDDCINDVVMKYDDGRDVFVAANQWYYLTLVMEGSLFRTHYEGSLYLNGIKTAVFTTQCKPDADGQFILGMDLDDSMMPKEYFDGLMDEVQVLGYPVAPSDIEFGGMGAPMCFDVERYNPGMSEVIAYYRFNEDLGDVTPDSMGNVHGKLAVSQETIWDATGMAWTSTGAPTVHTSYVYVGAPWYPTHTQSVSVPGGNSAANPAPLKGGDEVTIKGLNFAPINSRVFYGGSEILYEYVDHKTMTATIPDQKVPPACTEGGTMGLEVVNSFSGGNASCVESPTVQEGVDYTQSLDVPDLQHGLICYYPFFGDASDYAGNARHGSVTGALLVEDHDKFPDQAYSFGAADSISIGSCAGGKTVAMWIYYEDLPFPDPVFYADAPYTMFTEAGGCQASDAATLNNVWMHIVGVVDGGEVTKTYVNGLPSTNTAYSKQILSIVVDKSIGGGSFVGKIDDVWVWDRELCDSEIVATYHVQEYSLEFGNGASVSIPLTAPAQGSAGLLASFYGGGIEHFEVFDVISRDYEDQAPSAGFSVDEWSVELTGYIYAPVSQEFYFTITADDSFRLWINKGTPSLYTDWITTDGPVGEGPWTSHMLGVGGYPHGLFTSVNSGWINVINEPCLEPECPTRAVSGNIELNMGWYEIYMSYNDKKNNAAFDLKWQTTTHDITNGLIPKDYLRSGTGPFTVEAWVFPYDVEKDQTIVSRLTDVGSNGMGVGIKNGGMTASVYTGCACTIPKCDEFREVQSWKTVVKAMEWQHLAAAYDGKAWYLYVNGQHLDTIYYENVKFFPETSQPLVLGMENSEQEIVGLPDEIRMYHGLVQSFAYFTEALAPTIDCPLKGTEHDLRSYLMLDEGVGLRAYDFAGKSPVEKQFEDGVITAPPRDEFPLWVQTTGKDGTGCSTWGTNFYEVTIAGTALTEAMAGQCSPFTIVSYDKCGYKKLSGGDDYKVEVIGPLHLHTKRVELYINDGITDHGDGSYTVDFMRETSGYYMVKVYLWVDGGYVMRDAWKTFVHPYVSDASTTYMFDDLDDPLYLNELEYSMAGIPVSFKLQTVDAYGNLRTIGGVTDWEFTLSGPYDFAGTWEDNADGTYTFSYTAHVAGDYKMMVKMAGQPICMYNGRTCCGKAESAYSYCTAQNQPVPTSTGQEDGVGGYDYGFIPCTFCLTVLDGSSMHSHQDGIATVFPDTDDLDLENPFTIFAWVKPDANATANSTDQQYVLTKQSGYSGKGYWISLTPGVTGADVTVEGGVYVGTENFRIVRATAPYTDDWMHIALTYSGNELALYLDTVLATENTYYDEEVKMNKRNSQPLKVGLNFNGLVDNVLIYNSVRAPETFVASNLCPANMNPAGPAIETGLIAYYRFNENSGFATKDSSHNGNDGVVGLICDIAPQGKHLSLACPDAYIMTEILYANFGENDGGCGAYTVGDCVTANSTAVVAAECLGKASCTIDVSKDKFDEHCPTSSKSLAVNAVCSPPPSVCDNHDNCTPPPNWSLWSMEVAPTLLTQTSVTVDEFTCVTDFVGGTFNVGGAAAQPPWMHDITHEMLTLPPSFANPPAACGGLSSIVSAEAGKPVIWGLQAKDGCGYRSQLGTDSWEGSIKYDLGTYSVPESDQEARLRWYEDRCPEFPLNFPSDVRVEFLAGSMTTWQLPRKGVNGEVMDTTNYCSTYNDVYAFTYTAEVAGNATITLSYNGVTLMDAVPMVVYPAPISPGGCSDDSCTIGTTAEGTGMEIAEAGVVGMFVVTARDHFGNLRAQWGDEDLIELTVDGPASAAQFMEYGDVPGDYNFYITYPVEGQYNVTVKVKDVAWPPISTTTANVTGMSLRPVTALNAATPTARYEHSAVTYKDELYLFGGSTPDKTYLDQTMKFHIGWTGSQPDDVVFEYRKEVTVTNMPATDYTIELMVDTETLIAEGKLKPDAGDLRFFLKTGGEPLKHWVEPRSAPAGLDRNDTVVWVKVPGGVPTFWMYYGNKEAESIEAPAEVFHMFEDFELEGDAGAAGWSLGTASEESCGEGSPIQYGTSDMASFYTSEINALHGARALKVQTTDAFGGGSIMKNVTAGLSKFTMKAFMFDQGCEGAHWISPDFDVCETLEAAKAMLPTPSNGLGIYTSSSSDTYVTTYPWHSTGLDRQVQWNSMTFRDDDVSLSLSMNEYNPLPLTQRLNDPLVPTTDIDKLFIHGSYVVNQGAGSAVYWDAILVTEYDPTVSTALGEEETVTLDEVAEWTEVGTVAPPPARQAHSAVVYEDAMYVFGGERSAYEYADLWKYTFATDAWEFQMYANMPEGLGRHDHSAVVHGDDMYVYGGRSPAPVGDLWKYSFAAKTWTQLESSPGMAARFGHSAAVNDGVMYVYGGFVLGGGLTDEIWSYDLAAGTWTQVGPRYDNFDFDYVQSPTDSTVFPQEIPTPRFAHASVMTGKAPALYAIGGLGGTAATDMLASLWKFDLDTLRWELMMEHPLLGRYDSTATLFGDGKFAIVYGGRRYDSSAAVQGDMSLNFGGNAAAKFLDDMFVIWLGETGL